jgi:hypothetical protein
VSGDEDRVHELTALVIKTCRQLRLSTSVTRLLPRGVEVTGINEAEQRCLAQLLASPVVATVRDGSSVRVTLK